jgi:sugar phosphate isomerase/epimerase
MNRRMFLAGTGSAVAALCNTAFAQGLRAATAAPQNQGQLAARGRVPGTPANVPAAKLARVSILALEFGSILVFPWTQNPKENQTLNVLDLPQMIQDVYGVSHLEFQHGHFVDTSGNQDQRSPDPDFLRQMRAKLDAAKVTATQINMEIGAVPNLSGEARDKWMTCAKKWVDAAPILGAKRLLLNQSGLNEGNKANCISVWKEIQDYATPKGIMITAETRGSGGGRRVGDAVQPTDPRVQVRAALDLLADVIKSAGAYSTCDIGNAGAPDQQTENYVIKALYPSSSGNMHIKSSPYWDIGTTVRYTESLGYKGLYGVEGGQGDAAVRIIYNLILANIT